MERFTSNFHKEKKKKRKRKFTKPHIYTSNSPAYHFEICIGTVITHRCFCYTFFFLNKYPDVTFLDTLQIKWIFRAWPVVTGQSQFSVERFDFILNELYFKFDRVQVCTRIYKLHATPTANFHANVARNLSPS